MGSDAESAAATSAAQTTGAASSTEGATTGVDGSTSAGPSGPCDPAMSAFQMVPRGAGQASIAVDFAAMACAAQGATQMDPQLVFDVRNTGLVDVTGYGLEITESSHGQLFTDSPQGDSRVIDLMPDLETTITAVRTGGSEQVTVTFTIFSTGPTLVDVSAVFG